MNEFVNAQSLDFEEWASMAVRDPGGFEALRAAAIERLIDGSPDRWEPRLRGLQWQIDQGRGRAKDPAAAGLRITGALWDKVVGARGLLDVLDALSGAEASRPLRHRSATIVPFPCAPAQKADS